MPIKSLHGRAIGFDDEKCGFVYPRIKKGLIKQFKITSTQLLALNATPQTVLAAPGSGLVSIVRALHLYKPAGTAYSGVATGEDLVLKYTDASGSQAGAAVEVTGFLDSASAKRAYAAGPAGSGSTAVACLPVSNAALVMHMLIGEVTTGDSDLYGWLEYDVYPFALDLSPLT